MSDATTQPEALAEAHDLIGLFELDDDPESLYRRVAAVLRAYIDLTAEREALRAAFNAACAFIDCHVGDWDMTKEMVSKHAAFVKARAELAARAAKEQA